MSDSVPGVEHRDVQYFGYYAMLQHQQNMLQDTVRTSTYQSAILVNRSKCFQDKLVMDVGAGSGILSFFAAQAGAKTVYAVEASEMANKMKKLVESAGKNGKNAFLKDKIQVINAKIEEPGLPIPQVDTIVSEPIGVLLFHERMLESYIHARDHYLKPGGAMFPAKDAREEMFGMPVVGHFDPRNLITTPTLADAFGVDFSTISLSELQDITMPFDWETGYTGIMHGIAGWFDLLFTSPNVQPKTPTSVVELPTGPMAERTHWQQVRFLFREPLAVNATQRIHGWMRCIVNDTRSYTIYLEVVVGTSVQPSDPAQLNTETFLTETNSSPVVRRGKWELHEQTYNYSYIPGQTPEHKPEYSCLYQPEARLDDMSEPERTTDFAFDAIHMKEYEEFAN
ncbi:S-adenosyl-L-methionine-dependent methyltransferase [Spinellus fusiger]|nr:S-adenosyl-L-methionine-dependent methyltransferase [Spinellus fusiger]